jgi:hypothetical protein
MLAVRNARIVSGCFHHGGLQEIASHLCCLSLVTADLVEGKIDRFQGFSTSS